MKAALHILGKRLREPSTWAGFATAALIPAVSYPAFYFVAAGCSAMAVMLGEKKATDGGHAPQVGAE